MSNKYCQALVELRNKPAHELKEVGDQWRTPDNIFWGINTLFGPFVLDLFTDGDNAKCAAYYTAGIPFSECSSGASSRTGEKRRHHDKAWRGPGDNASYRGEGRRQRGGRDYSLTACR
ncbi:TPA: hypothetical protein L1W16_003811 [Escherichia coli]|nr:hypothetical protein [Escherichia coli]